MTRSKNHGDRDALENVFAAARRDTPRPDENLTGVILASAQTELHRRRKPAMVNFFTESMAGIFAPQGWRLATGLCASLMLGLWLGLSGLPSLPVMERLATAIILPADSTTANTDTLDDPFSGLDDNLFGEADNG